MGIVSVTGLRKDFTSRGERVTAVDGIDLELAEGEFVCLLGPSGCGKTTTLRSIAGLEQPTGGTITIAGQVVYSGQDGTFVPPEKRGLGMMFQSYAVWPHMTVRQNIEFPLRHGVGRGAYSREQIRQRVDAILEVADCTRLADRHPAELSGGQQQRVALARTLVYEPSVLLFDEPLSNLDAKLRERMRSELRALQKRLNFTAVYVTHDREEALTMADRVVVMSHGGIVQVGRPEEIYARPETAFVADFIGPADILPVLGLPESAGLPRTALTPVGPVVCGASARLTDGGPDGPDASVLVRPSDVEVADRPLEGVNTWRGRVERSSYLGEHVMYGIRIEGTLLNALVPVKSRVAGEEVWVRLDPEGCRLVNGRLSERGAAGRPADGREHGAAESMDFVA